MWLFIKQISFIRGAHPANTDYHPANKRDRLCIYCYRSLQLETIYIQFLKECINFHLITFHLYYFTLPTNFNPFFVVLDCFNRKSLNWGFNDEINFEGKKTDTLISQIGLHLIVKDPKQILDCSSSSVDLIITSKTNLVLESVISASASLHTSYHQQTIYRETLKSIWK